MDQSQPSPDHPKNSTNGQSATGSLGSFPSPCKPYQPLSGSGLIHLARMSSNPFSKLASKDGETGEDESNVPSQSIIRPSVLASAFNNSSPASSQTTGSGAAARSFLRPSRLADTVGLSLATSTSATMTPGTTSTSTSTTTASGSTASGVPTSVITSSSTTLTSQPTATITAPISSTVDGSGKVLTRATLPAQESAKESKESSSSSKHSHDGSTAEKPQNYFSQYLSSGDTSSANGTDAGETGSSGSFVFGSNMGARVIGGDVGLPATATTNTHKPTDEDDDASSSSKKSLVESARECEEKHEQDKPKLEPVTLHTGEEDECNALQISAKLYVFCKDKQQWLERGAGTLKLNDKRSKSGDAPARHIQSRLVFRTYGIFKVVLNTKIWPGMLLDKASEKSVRFSAQDTSDQNTIRMYLVKSNNKDVDSLYSAISNRIKRSLPPEEETPPPVEESVTGKRDVSARDESSGDGSTESNSSSTSSTRTSKRAKVEEAEEKEEAEVVERD